MPQLAIWLLCTCSVLACAGGLYFAFVSAPATLRKQMVMLQAEMRELTVQQEGLAQRWLTYKTEMEGLNEAVEDALESIERKRRRIAASDSKKKRDDEAAPPMTPLDYKRSLARKARSLGHAV